MSNKMTKTIEQQITEMLKENTGAHFLDSGGAYGRHWEKNQSVDFDAQPILKVEYDKERGFDGATLSVYHFLINTLSVTKESEKLNRALQRYINKKQNEELSYHEIIEQFAEEYLQPRGFRQSDSDNVYNYDCMLSQVYTFSYIYAQHNEDYPDYIIIQIHNGCDVRGGYTSPRIFAIEEFEAFIMSQHDLRAECKCTSLNSDDQGYHWYVESEPEIHHENIDKILGIEGTIQVKQEIEEYKLPRYWKVTESEENMICSKCNETVEFQSSFGA